MLWVCRWKWAEIVCMWLPETNNSILDINIKRFEFHDVTQPQSAASGPPQPAAGIFSTLVSHSNNWAHQRFKALTGRHQRYSAAQSANASLHYPVSYRQSVKLLQDGTQRPNIPVTQCLWSGMFSYLRCGVIHNLLRCEVALVAY